MKCFAWRRAGKVRRHIFHKDVYLYSLSRDCLRRIQARWPNQFSVPHPLPQRCVVDLVRLPPMACIGSNSSRFSSSVNEGLSRLSAVLRSVSTYSVTPMGCRPPDGWWRTGFGKPDEKVYTRDFMLYTDLRVNNIPTAQPSFRQSTFLIKKEAQHGQGSA